MGTDEKRATDPKTIGRRWFEDVWTNRQDDLIEELMAENAYGHVEGGEVTGPADFRQMRDTFLSALPDIRIEVEDVLGEGNQAVVRWRATGTHGGDGFGFKATGRPIDIRGMTWLVVEDGKIVEGWDAWNLGGVLQKLQAE